MILKSNVFSPKIGNKARISTLTMFIQHCPGGYSKYNNVRKRKKKVIKSEKNKVKSSFIFICSNMTLHVKYPKKLPKKLLELNK